MAPTTLRREIKKSIDRLPPARLASLADYVAFLERPELVARIAASEKAIVAGKGRAWRGVRRDV
ncbi:MAG: hypothetical protein ACKVZJ_15175 [Phycisphaerales bacterium]